MELVRAGRTVQDVTAGMYSAVTFHELYQIAARAGIDPKAARERRKAAGAAWARLNSQQLKIRRQKGGGGGT
jgi:NAD(P) transhydrogenase